MKYFVPTSCQRGRTKIVPIGYLKGRNLSNGTKYFVPTGCQMGRIKIVPKGSLLGRIISSLYIINWDEQKSSLQVVLRDEFQFLSQRSYCDPLEATEFGTRTSQQTYWDDFWAIGTKRNCPNSPPFFFLFLFCSVKIYFFFLF